MSEEEEHHDNTQQLQDLIQDTEIWEDMDTSDKIIKILSKHDSAAVLQTIDAGHNTFVHQTALWDRPPVLEHLVSIGCDLNKLNLLGQSPLDMAMHWCHYDTAELIQHYGGKHSYESERDAAISQRDLAIRRIEEANFKTERALSDVMKHRLEFEDMKMSRDKAVEDSKELENEKNLVVKKCSDLENKLADAKKEYQKLRIEMLAVREELAVSERVKKNATTSWELAQEHALHMEKLNNAEGARAEEAVFMRDEAICERNAARDLMQQHKDEQALALARHGRAENERDEAIDEMQRMKERTRKKIEYWAEIVVNAEEDKRNVSRDIALQTAELKKQISALQQELGEVTLQRLELQEKEFQSIKECDDLKSEVLQSKMDAEKANRNANRLERELKVLAAARKKERDLWFEKQDNEIHEETKDTMQDLTRQLSVLLKTASKFVDDSPKEEKEYYGQSGLVLSPIKPREGLSSASAANWKGWGDREQTPGIRWTRATLSRYQHEVGGMIKEIVGLLNVLYTDTQEKIREQRQLSTAQKRIINRKDALIQRIVQSRQEPRSVEVTSHFRDCAVKPMSNF